MRTRPFRFTTERFSFKVQTVGEIDDLHIASCLAKTTAVRRLQKPIFISIERKRIVLQVVRVDSILGPKTGFPFPHGQNVTNNLDAAVTAKDVPNVRRTLLTAEREVNKSTARCEIRGLFQTIREV